jgi:hypothetical protein
LPTATKASANTAIKWEDSAFIYMREWKVFGAQVRRIFDELLAGAGLTRGLPHGPFITYSREDANVVLAAVRHVRTLRVHHPCIVPPAASAKRTL